MGKGPEQTFFQRRSTKGQHQVKRGSTITSGTGIQNTTQFPHKMKQNYHMIQKMPLLGI